MKKWLSIVLLFASIIVVIITGVILWVASKTYHATETATALLAGQEKVSVEITPKYYHFKNTTTEATQGIIFYPGGLVDPASYAPLCVSLTLQRYDCFIARVNFNLAIVDGNIADSIIAKYTTITDWVIGGHSLGGVVACRFVESHKDAPITGIFLLASYCDVSVANRNVAVVTVVGTEDRVLNAERFDQALRNVPVDVIQISIKGGNHAQFGEYGVQSGDGTATITATHQRNITVVAIERILSR